MLQHECASYGDASALAGYAWTQAGAAYGTVQVTPQQEQDVLQAYLPMVKRVVRQLASQAMDVMDQSDMTQVGLMGLLEALRRYGPVDEAIRHSLFMRTYSQRVSAVPTDERAPDADLARQARAAGVRVCAPARALALVDGKAEVTDAQGQRHRYDTLYPVLGGEVQSALALALGAAHDDEHGLRVDPHMQTSVDGLYAIGDVVSALNQISVAVGHAAIAATAVHNRLPRNLRGGD